MKALGWRGGIAPTRSRPGHYIGAFGQRHAPAVFYPRGKDPRYLSSGGWVGPTVGLDTEFSGKIPLPLPGIEPRSPGRPARSQTLY
jgi:hypothetical protein